MAILILGATGLIGRHLLAALDAAGLETIGASRRPPPDGGAAAGRRAWRALDFAASITPDAWLPHLDGVTAVVNCVGILREHGTGDYERVHHLAPAALFAACERLGIRRVIHLSALGSAADAPTAYWRSKAAGERALALHAAHQPLAGPRSNQPHAPRPALDGVIVRPSLVYGADGASSRLFLALATLPLLALPTAPAARVQPVHIDDLCDALLALLQSPSPPPGLAAVGPRALGMADYLAGLRGGMATRPGIAARPALAAAPSTVPVLAIPMPLARLAARVAALHPASALTPDALAMLAAGASGCNTASAAPMRALLGGRALRDPATFATPAQRPAAVLAWAMPLATLAMAMLWLWTAYVSWFAWPHADSVAWLAACGIPTRWGETVLGAASLLDAAIGCALLAYRRRWLWPLQCALVAGYTLAMTFCLPEFWLHPFGPLSKNLPVLALLLAMWRLDGGKERN